MVPTVLRTRPLTAFFVTAATIVLWTGLTVTTASAQGGGGGGRGRGGGATGGPTSKSPADMIRENLDNDNPLKFLMDHRKPLDLTKMQRDSIERLRDELKDMQKPIFKDIESELRKMPAASRGGDGGGGGSRGGGSRGGGSRGGGGGGIGGTETGAPGGGRDMGTLPDTVRALVDRLADIQNAFGDRGRAQLTAPQLATADSLHTAWLEEQRKEAELRRKRDR